VTAPELEPAARLAADRVLVLGSGPPGDVVDGLAAAPPYPNVVTVIGDLPEDWPAALTAIVAALPECRGVRLAISTAATGEPSPAAELAKMISAPVQASPGPVLALPGGRLFAPTGWCWSAPGRTAITDPSGHTLPAPPWEPELDRFVGPGSPPGLRVLPTPSGLWITSADAPAPYLDDPVVARTEDDDGTALVVVGDSEGPPPDRDAVAGLAADIADLDVPVRFVGYDGRTLDPAEPEEHPAGATGPGTVSEAVPDTGPDLEPDAVSDAVSDTGPDLEPDPVSDAAPDTGPDLGPDPGPPWWVGNGLVHEIEVGYDHGSDCFVLGGTTLTPGALGERAAADPARRGRPVFLHCGAEPPGWVVQTVADQIHAPVVVRMTTRPGWRVHRYREIDRGSPLPLETDDVATMDDMIRMMVATPPRWVPRPAPEVEIPVRPGPAITVGCTGGPVRPFTAGGVTLSAWELAACVWPRLRGATELAVHTETGDQATAGALDHELQLLATFLGMTVTTPAGRRFTPRGAPAVTPAVAPAEIPADVPPLPDPLAGHARPAGQDTVAGVAPPPAPAEPHTVGPVALTALPRPRGARPAAPVSAKRPRLPPAPPGEIVARPAPRPAAAPVAAAAPIPEHVPVPGAPAAASTAEQHQLLRQALDWRYDVYLRQVTRALAQRPGLRADALAPDSVVPDLVAVTALLNGGAETFFRALRADPRDETGAALVACLCGGLRRLPRQLGVTYAASAPPPGGTEQFERGNVLVDNGILAGSTAAPELAADDVELVIWSATGCRVDGFAGEDTRGLVLFPPGTLLVVLGNDGSESPARLFLAERRAVAGDPDADDRVLSKLRAARPATRSSASGPVLEATRSLTPARAVRLTGLA
jgi:hypothetical protein